MRAVAEIGENQYRVTANRANGSFNIVWLLFGNSIVDAIHTKVSGKSFGESGSRGLGNFMTR